MRHWTKKGWTKPQEEQTAVYKGRDKALTLGLGGTEASKLTSVAVLAKSRLLKLVKCYSVWF